MTTQQASSPTTGPDQARTTMRRVVVRAPGEVVVEDAPVPTPAADEALVRTLVVGVCGSDTHAAHGRHPFISLPYAPGHEVVGVVEELGPDATTGVEGQALAVGDRVVVEPTLVCGACKQCLSGRENLCENLQFFGCGYAQGGMADRFTVPARRLHRVPDMLDDLQAALVEPLSTPVHAVRLAGGDLRGKAVVILGSGTIGLLVLAAARAAGAERVVMTDPLPSKRRRALDLGAAAALDATSETLVDDVRTELGESADVVFDCVAVPPTVRAAIGMALKGGTVVVVGVPAADVSIPLPLVQDAEVRVQGSATYAAQDYAESVRIIAAGGVRVEQMITRQLPLEDAAAAFEASAGGEEVKVVVLAGGESAPAR